MVRQSLAGSIISGFTSFCFKSPDVIPSLPAEGRRERTLRCVLVSSGACGTKISDCALLPSMPTASIEQVQSDVRPLSLAFGRRARDDMDSVCVARVL